MAPKSLLPVATLCFLLLLVLAAQSEEDAVATLVIDGKARCKSDPSRIISNTTLEVWIDGVMIHCGTCTTTSTGQVAITVNLTSKAQVASLTSNGKAYLVAPPHACGVPSLPPGKVVAAAVNVTATVSGSGGAGREQRPSSLAASDGLVRQAIINGNLHATNKDARIIVLLSRDTIYYFDYSGASSLLELCALPSARYTR